MNKNIVDLCGKHLPNWLQSEGRKIFSKKVKIRPNIVFIAVITSCGQFYEFWNKEIHRECSLWGDTDELPASQRSSRISLEVLFTYTVTGNRRIFYLIRISRKLFVVERMEKNLIFRVGEDNVLAVEIEDKSGDGSVTVLITKSDGSFSERTFSGDGMGESMDVLEGEPEKPSDFLLTYLEGHNRKLSAGLQMRRKVLLKELHRIRNKSKYGPIQTSSVPPGEEAAPLVKYGQVWVKFHNDRIVFGIPIFNTTSTRRRVALNVRPWLANAQLDRLNYEFKLYKIRNDSCTFENVDELFDCEEPSYANASDFQHDWMPFEENNLQPGLSALLVANIHVMDFSRISMYKFTVYVRYEISQADGRVWELQLMAGEVEITPQIFFRPLFQTELRERKFLYRDFLAIASTSSYQVIHIVGTSEISRRFDCFLMENLKFQRVSLPETFVADASSAPIMDEAMEVSVREDVEMRDDSRFMGTGMFDNQTRPTATFYQQDDFWRGALIRVKEINKFKLMLKVYMRTHNHLAVFVQAIKMDFGIKVEFSQEENPQNICTVLRSLVDEINCKRQVLQMLPECPGNKLRCRKSFEEVLCCELKTNYAFHKLSGK